MGGQAGPGEDGSRIGQSILTVRQPPGSRVPAGLAGHPTKQLVPELLVPVPLRKEQQPHLGGGVHTFVVGLHPRCTSLWWVFTCAAVGHRRIMALVRDTVGGYAAIGDVWAETT